jgi:two-component system OmpR family sensor kinase
MSLGISLRTRITLSGIGIVALVLGAISALWIALIAGSAPQNQDKELAVRADAAVRSLGTATAEELAPRPPVAATDVADASGRREIVVLVLDDTGAVLSSTGVVAGAPPRIPAELLATARASGSAVGTVSLGPGPGPGPAGREPAGSVALRVHVRPWQRPDLGRRGFVVTGQTSTRVQNDRVVVVAVLLLSAAGSLVAAAVGIWLVAGRALRPLRQLTAMADEVGRSGDLGRRLPDAPRRDDVGRLTASFNAMMARLQDAHRRMAGALAAQQRFTADASHELRTPLTTVRSSAGFLRTHPDAAEPDRAAALADLEAEAARMSRLVADLLMLARADGGQPLRAAPVELGELTRQVCRQAATLHPRHPVHCAADGPAAVLGEEDGLRRLLWILLDNTAAHTPPGTSVWVSAARLGDRVRLAVCDDGPGIPAPLLERIFDRFYRAGAAGPSAAGRGAAGHHAGPPREPDAGPEASAGAGLGLSIARSIAWAHGGWITATGNDRGGAAFVVELPAHVSSNS